MEQSEKNGDNNENAATESADLSCDGAVTVKGEKYSFHVMSIIGQIEGHYILGGGQKSTRYEHLIPALAEVEEDPGIDGLLLILNTMGGDVEAGLALAEMIAGMQKPTVSLVLGGGHSIGIPLAVSTKKSFIVPSATMTLHPVRTNGLVVDSPQTYLYFERMQKRILRFIADHSHAQMEDMQKKILAREEMATDLGTILEGREAVDMGLIDEVGSLGEALAALRQMRDAQNEKTAQNEKRTE